VDQTAPPIDEQEVIATFRRSKGGNSYFIDKPVGLITVNAPRPLQKRLEAYFKSLKKELYKQISIEAKIIEVQLDDHSAIGLNWNQIFENLTIGGSLTINRSYSKTDTDGTNSSLTNNRSNTITRYYYPDT
jgi:type II secretory pathway component GspD/PulD (secretin)